MNTKTKYIIGNSINYLLSAVLIISGVLKLVGFEPYKEMDEDDIKAELKEKPSNKFINSVVG